MGLLRIQVAAYIENSLHGTQISNFVYACRIFQLWHLMDFHEMRYTTQLFNFINRFGPVISNARAISNKDSLLKV